MNAITLRIPFRLHRVELVGAVILVGAAAVAMFVLASMLDEVGWTDCYQAQFSTSYQQSAACDALGRRFWDLAAKGTPLQFVLFGVPYLLALFTGVALVGRELERGTGRLVWTLHPSRLRWFLGRLAPILAVVVAVALVGGAALDRFLEARMPGVDPANAFVDIAMRGPLLAAWVVFAFSIAVLMGALIGRVLPGLLASILLAAFLFYNAGVVRTHLLEGMAVPVPLETATRGGYDLGEMQFGQYFERPDGTLLTFDEMQAIDPIPQDGSEWRPRYPAVQLVLPGSRYPEVMAAEIVALGLASLVVLGAAGLAVRRARP